MAQKRTLVNVVSLELPEDVVTAIVPSGSGPADVSRELKRLATYFITKHAEGGMLLESRNLDAIERATDAKMLTPKDIVEAISKAMGREDGQYTIKASIDPAFIEQIREVAGWQGCTIDELLTNCVNLAMTNGWLYEFNARNGMMIDFEGENWDTLCAFMGKGAFTGAEIAAKIRTMMAAASEEKAETTPATQG